MADAGDGLSPDAAMVVQASISSRISRLSSSFTPRTVPKVRDGLISLLSKASRRVAMADANSDLHDAAAVGCLALSACDCPYVKRAWAWMMLCCGEIHHLISLHDRH